MNHPMSSRVARYSLASSSRRLGLHKYHLNQLATLMCHSSKTAELYYTVGADDLNRRLVMSLEVVNQAVAK